jgi:glycosyltransferase involved in cell wall biosynthesis
VKVVFTHPSYPNQFTDIAHALAEDWDCSFLVNQGFTDAIKRDDPPIPYYGFVEEDAAFSGSYYTKSIEEGIRRGKAVVEALLHIKETSGIDLVVGHASFGTTFYIREILKVPVVSYVELPGYFPVYCRDEFPAQYAQALIDAPLRALIHSSVLNSDLCIVPSGYAKRLFPPDLAHKVRVQMEGFDLPALHPDKKALRRELGLSGDVPIVGFAARTLEGVRGFDIFVKAAQEIQRARSDVRFLAIGNEETIYGNETMFLGDKSFKRYVFETTGMSEAAFIFKPFMPRADYIRHIQAMDVILFPMFEGAANWGLFEAMACGIPVLASNRCFIPEVIQSGREGILFEANDASGFAQAALDGLEDPARYARLGINARRRIADHFSIANARDGYASILQEAVAKKA